MAPPPLSRINGTTAWTMLKIDFTLTSKMRSNVASSTSRIGRLRCVTPALLTTMSGTPNAWTVRLDGIGDGFAGRDVGLDGERPAADRVGDTSRLIASHVDDRDMRALRGEPPARFPRRTRSPRP